MSIVFHCKKHNHMLAKLCSKSFKLGFSSTGTKNFQIYKLGFKEAERNCQQSLDHGETETARRNNLKHTNTTLTAENEKELKSHLGARVKRLA